MLTIVIIRPGATDYDEQCRIQGSLNMPLSLQGVEESRQLVEQLKQFAFDVIYCSDCEAAKETGELLAAKLDVRLKKLDQMCNLNHGLWQGLLVDEVKRKQPKVYRQWSEQPESVCPPEGETIAEARERVQTALAKIFRKYKQGVVGLVLPEPLASIARCALNHGELGDLWQATTGHGHWEAIEIDPSGAVHAVTWRGVPVE